MTVGANLLDFVGEPNSREVGEKIRQRIVAVLTRPGLIAASDLTINVAPVSIDSILVTVVIAAASTPNNSIVNETIAVSYLFDYSEQAILPIQPNSLYSSQRSVSAVTGTRRS